jgi:quercetin dioxygenase-like cupin family protein
LPEKGGYIMNKIAHLISGMLLGALLAAFAYAVSSKMVSAQDPAKLAPQNYRVLLENSQVRVIEYRLKPGEKEPMHSHPSGVIVYFFSDARIRTYFPDGKTAEESRRAGDTLWREPVTHAGENIGDTEAHALLIEPKNPCKK